MIDFYEGGHTLMVGFPLSDIAKPTTTVGNVYGVAQIASAASSSDLSSEFEYPYFSRLASSTFGYPQTIKEALMYFHSIKGAGWTEVAVISAVASFVNNLATTFIDIAEPEITILSFQQFLLGSENDLGVEFRELQNSGARVFFAPIFDNWQGFMETANSFGLVGENYVWIAPPSIVGVPFPDPNPLLQGTIGAVFATREPGDPILENFLDIWHSLDPDEYVGAGPDNNVGGSFAYIAFDMGIAAAMAIDKINQMGKLNDYIPPELWNEVIRSISFEGVSNSVAFEANGDRIGAFNLQYYSMTNNSWTTAATWSAAGGYQYRSDVVWYSNSTEIPDLDIRDPYHYWSCHDKQMLYDETGKQVELHSPDSRNIDDIDSDYHCDRFIDCQNMSDESSDCSSDYVILFIVFGVVTGILILICLLLGVFVVIFGSILNYRRLRSASPFFLLLIIISVIVGYISIYAWFGKPHPVACGFQPWLLGLPAISMIAALTVKNFRIWRIFRFPLKKLTISNFELFILWCIVMIPAVVILLLWTIISTPTATMSERDGKEHYVCDTGGFTGPPGGLVFFFILVGYTAFVLFLGAIISVLVRNVPSLFNETRLMTISIYNLIFLGAVIIPVYLVVVPINPFIGWILRTCAVLYAFTATLVLQFVPILIGVFFVDKGKNDTTFKSIIKGLSDSATHPTTKPNNSFL